MGEKERGGEREGGRGGRDRRREGERGERGREGGRGWMEGGEGAQLLSISTRSTHPGPWPVCHRCQELSTTVSTVQSSQH